MTDERGGGRTGGSRNPDDFLGYTIARLAHVMQHRIEAALKREVGLTVRQFGVLAHLARDPGMGSGQLARLVLITAQSMGPLLDGLEEQGLIVRDRAAARGTRMRTRLTQAGEAALEAAYAVAARLSEAEQAGMTAADAAALNAVLLRLLRALSASPPG